MEIQKPHFCPICGKRYKNPNGLKYHKGHSPACEKYQRQQASSSAEPSSQSTNSSAQAAGLPETGDEMMM